MNNNINASQVTLVVLSAFIGVLGGFGAIIFRGLIGFFHNIFFAGKLSFVYSANDHIAASVWGVGIIVVPVLGSFVVTWLTKNFAPEAKGHGVPEVIKSIYFEKGIIRPVVVVVKAFASALTIATGGSVGREGPIIQMGSACGSVAGGLFQMPARQKNILIAAGAAAGIAATFNTPLGAIAFAIELLLTSISASSLLPLAIATVFATYVGRTFLGTAPSFYVYNLTLPDFHLMSFSELMIFIPFGILIGLSATFFIKGLYAFEDWFDAYFSNPYLRHGFGMLVFGCLIYGFFYFSGAYYVAGIGYSTLVDLLNGFFQHPVFLLILFFGKSLATFLTLGSGGSGGVFSPSLFLGGVLGGLFGVLLKHLLPGLDINPIIFVIAGMGGMVGGTTGAVLTAIIMITEMTQDSNITLPIITTVVTAYAMRKWLSKGSIYTIKLLRQGYQLPEGLQPNTLSSRTVGRIMSSQFKVVEYMDIVKQLSEYRRYYPHKKHLIVVDNGDILGLWKYPIVQDDADSIDPKDLKKYIDRRFFTTHKQVSMYQFMRLKAHHQARFALVLMRKRFQKSERIIGIVTGEELLQPIHQDADLVD